MVKYNNNNQSLSQQLPLAAVLILSVPAAIIILLTIFGNLLVLFFKARVGRTNTTLLVWNLGLTDFLVGLFVLPMGAIYLLNRRWAFGHVLCRIWVAADVTFCTCSVVTICIISVDRYLAVTRPLRYKSVVTKLKVVAAIVLIWTFSLGILLATVRWDFHSTNKESRTCFVGDQIRYLAHSVVFAFFLPASVTLTLYWRIYSLARDRQRALDRGFLMILGHNMNFLTNTLTQTTALRVHVGKNNGMVEHQRRVLRTHERIAKTLGVVSCSFLFCWLPFFSLYLFNYQCENCIPTLVIDISSWLGYCNSMLNPIIYSFTVKEFKRSAFCFILPVWQCAHKWMPQIVAKPPDRKRTQKIVRKTRQQQTTPQQQRSKTATLPGGLISSTLTTERRRLSRARTGAIATLMVNTNCSIAQNALTSAAMMHKKQRIKCQDDECRESESKNSENREEQNDQKLINKLPDQNGAKKDKPKRPMIALNRLARKMRARRMSSISLDDLDVRKFEDNSKLFNRSGLVTTTLLLATSGSIGGGGEQHNNSEQFSSSAVDEPNSMPIPFSSSFSSSSTLSSNSKMKIRMPCKMRPPLRKLKRHSLPETHSPPPEAKHRRGRALFTKKFRKNETAQKSPTGRLWKRAKALALWRQLKLSEDNSEESLARRKKKFAGSIISEDVGGIIEKIGENNKKYDDTIHIVCMTDEISL